MFDHELYERTQNVQGAIWQAALMVQPNAGQMTSVNPLLQIRRGLAESPNWFMVQAAEFDPEPLTIENLRRRAVWSSPRIVAAVLELLAGEKWLDRINDNYHLTDEGRRVIDTIWQRYRQPISALDARLTVEDRLHVSRLESLLRQIIDASLAGTTDTWCLVHSRRRAPSDEAAPLLKIFHYCEDLNAFRDDAHMAAFQPLAMPAYAWEAFAQVWYGTADTAQGVYDQLAYRGYSRTEYAQGLQECARRGWLTETTNVYQVTNEGKRVREEAERLTNEYFYASWKRDDVQAGLRELEDMLKGIE